jgi:hypothetical protein
MLSPSDVSVPDELSDTPPNDLTLNPLYDDDRNCPTIVKIRSLECDPTSSNTEPTLRTTVTGELREERDAKYVTNGNQYGAHEEIVEVSNMAKGSSVTVANFHHSHAVCLSVDDMCTKLHTRLHIVLHLSAFCRIV